MSATAGQSSGSANGRPSRRVGDGAERPAGAASAHVESNCIRQLSDGARIVAGNAGDHPLVLQLLVEARRAPLSEDFQSRLDAPMYRPSDRLLVQREQTLTAHVHLASHIAWFEGQRVPVVKLEDFAALPQYHAAGYEDELLSAAESIAAAEGAVVALANVETPAAFVARGWTLLRGQGHTRAYARGVLAHLDAQEAARRRRRKSAVQVRAWRHFELDEIRSTYDLAATPLWGPLHRSEAAWQWLVGRNAQDLILLAADGAATSADVPLENGSPAATGAGRVVGYAIVRGSCIVEMMTLPEFAAARTQLLARACREAMDRDHHSISLYTPAADPLHELLVTAGGAWISDAQAGGPRWLAKLLAPEKWVDRMFPAWHERARAANLPRPWELGLVAGRQPRRFTLTRRSARLEPTDGLPAAHIECDQPTFDSLLLGNLSLPAAVAGGQLRASDAALMVPLAALFAPRLFWQSALELMRL